MAMDPERRRGLKGLLAAGFWPYALRAEPTATGERRCVAAWDSPDGQHWVGVLQVSDGPALAVLATQALPTRAHGLTWADDGSVLVVARRPGEWLLRWHPLRRSPAQWHWLSGPRVLGGHALEWPDRTVVYTVEQDGNSGQGWLVARDRHSFTVQAAWPTGGLDPHMALADGPDHVLVANGGVAPAGHGRPDAGLASSLVRLCLRDGSQVGTWSLADRHLSLRHLARHASGCVGVALQAEHPQPTARINAPLLALFEGQRLQLAEAPPGLGGYGGDITTDAEGFVVSASRAAWAQGEAGALARWDLAGRLLQVRAWPQAGAVGQGWAAGKSWQTPPFSTAVAPAGVKAWDNHLA